MIQAGWLRRVVNHLNTTLTLHMKPDGTRRFPAPSCCYLKENYPNVESGMSSCLGLGGGTLLLFMPSGPYWIDPNGGCEKDAVEVWCDFTNASCQSCVDPVKKVSCCCHARNEMSLLYLW